MPLQVGGRYCRITPRKLQTQKNKLAVVMQEVPRNHQSNEERVLSLLLEFIA